jgi:hypothetical protein
MLLVCVTLQRDTSQQGLLPSLGKTSNFVICNVYTETPDEQMDFTTTKNPQIFGYSWMFASEFFDESAFLCG